MRETWTSSPLWPSAFRPFYLLLLPILIVRSDDFRKFRNERCKQAIEVAAVDRGHVGQHHHGRVTIK